MNEPTPSRSRHAVRAAVTFFAVSVVCLGIVNAVPAAATPPAAETATIAEGVIQQVVVDHEDGSETRRTLLSGRDGLREVTGLDTVASGSRVRVTLNRADARARWRSRAITLLAPPAKPTAVATAGIAAQPVVIVPVQWSGHPVAIPAQSVADVVNEDSDSYWKDASGGRIGFQVSSVKAALTLTRAVCTTSGGLDSAALNQIYARAGMTQGAENGVHVLAYFNNFDTCGWAGLGTVSAHNPAAGGWLMINGVARLDVIGHELGHNQGLGHSSLRWCTRSAGVRVSDANSGCTVQPYGDPYDIMGIAWGTSGYLNAAQRDALGLLSPGGIVDIPDSGQVTLAPLASSTGTRAVRLVDGSARYWLEYRTSTGRDIWLDGSPSTSWYAVPGSGVVVHRADSLGPGQDTELIDTRPIGPDLDRAALQAGEQWAAASGLLRVKVLSASAGGAVVEITRGEMAPGSPSAAAPVSPRAVLRVGTAGSVLPVTVNWSVTNPGNVCGQYFAGATNSLPLPVTTRSRPDLATTGKKTRWTVSTTTCSGPTVAAAGESTAAAVQDGSLRFAGTWPVTRSSALFGGSGRVNSAPGAKAYQTVTARSAGLIATKSATQGKFQLYVDGRLRGTIDLYSARPAARQVVWSTNWTTSGRHTITMINLATKGRPQVNVDALVTLV
jgi:hypothetical protein